MTPLIHLAGVELRRFRRSRLTRAALLALLLIPLLYGALYLWAFWDPYGNLDKVPAALVVDDKAATVAGHTVHAGADLERKLRDGDGGFGWHVTDDEDAADGLDQGRYYLVVTVPADFSAHLASAAGADPQPAVLDVRTDDANGYLAGQLSKSVLAQIRAALASNATKDYVSNVYVSMAQLHDQLGSAAQGARDLASGTSSARTGADRLADGAAGLASGAAGLETGARQASAGASRLAGGATTLASGLDHLDAATSRLPAQAQALSQGAAKVAAGTRQVATIGTRLTAAGQSLEQARAEVRSGLLADLQTYVAAHPDDAEAARLATSIRTRLEALDTRLAATGGGLATAGGQTTALAAGANQVAAGAATLARSAPALAQGVHAADTGAHRLATGATTLVSGTSRLAGGAGQLRSGAQQAAAGAGSLTSGLVRLDDATHQLADGLSTGAKAVPNYTGAAATDRAGVVADPVHVRTDPLNGAGTYGAGFAPYFIPLALWVGALVTYMLLRPLAPRSLASSARALRVTAAGWLPAAAMGVVQAGALIAVLHLGLGLDAEHPIGLLLFLGLVALTYTAIMQLVGAAFGAPGRLVALILLMLQLTSAGGTYPIETAPRFFQWLHPVLPMSYVVTGLRHLISGGPMDAVWRCTAVLVAFAVVSLALTVHVARRQRVWTMQRLHPELSL